MLDPQPLLCADRQNHAASIGDPLLDLPEAGKDHQRI
jgi:hypothetical protein